MSRITDVMVLPKGPKVMTPSTAFLCERLKGSTRNKETTVTKYRHN